MQLHVIDTELFKLDGGAMFGVVPRVIWQKLNPPDENNLCTWAMRCLLVEDGQRRILIDTGIGNKQDAKFFSHYHLHGPATLDSSLTARGLTRDDITDVLLTHLHFDHVGGAVDKVDGKLVPAFKNATYWSNTTHWQWATQPNRRERASFLPENILPLQESGQLRLIEEQEGMELFPGLRIRLVNGHTKAMMLPQLQYQGRTVVYMADLFPSLAHLPLPYVMAYDMFPLDTLREKAAFLDEAVKNDYVLFFEHDARNECCTLQSGPKGVVAKDVFKLCELK